MARDGHLHLRITSELRAKLEQLAAADKRTLSAYVEKLLEEHAANTTTAKDMPPRRRHRR
jgi:predicted HicB family RNase H-like nuclease